MKQWRGRLLTLEALFFLSLIALLRRTVPMRVWSGLIGTARRPVPLEPPVACHRETQAHDAFESQAQRAVSSGISRACRRFPGRFSCLEQASAGRLMLCARGFSSAVVIGLAKFSDAEDSNDLAHAWLETPHGILVGGIGATNYTAVTRFVHDEKAETPPVR